MEDQESAEVSRRLVLRGAAVGAVALPVLTACGSGPEKAAAPQGGQALTSTKDVPVGGGTVLSDQKIVVTQPAQGEFKAFSSICTHQGCPVSEIQGDAIVCNCHGSKFSIADGSVLNPPASEPLEEASTTVEGDTVVIQA